MQQSFLAGHRKTQRIISILLILIFIFGLSYLLLCELLKQEQQSAVDKNMHFADMTATALDDFISSDKIVLQNLASLDDVQKERRAEITQTLQDFTLVEPEISLLWVADANGTLVAKYPDVEADQNVSDRDYFKESMAGKTFVGGPYIGRVTGNEIMTITEPYYRDNKVAGIVGMSFPLNALQKKMSKTKVDFSGYDSLLNMEGQVLIHPDRKEFSKTFSFEDSPLYQKIRVAKETRGYFEKTPNDTEQGMHTFATLKEAPWVVVVVEPLAEFNFKTNQLRGRNFMILLSLILICIFMAHYFLILRDIKNTEENKQTEKLALAGELAAGIAHEIRNPLTSIKGFIQLISIKNGQEIPSFYFETVLEELERIDQIVGELVVLAKPAPGMKREVDLNKVLQDTVQLMSYQAHMNEVELILDIEPELPCILGVSNQLKQVFINLIKNAIEAIENGGTVTIQTERQVNDVVVMIKDTGKGMDKKEIGQLGTPFYSNKDMGTGLGLMISYRIIQNHKGKVFVQSKVGAGTQFIISFPRVTSSDEIS